MISELREIKGIPPLVAMVTTAHLDHAVHPYGHGHCSSCCTDIRHAKLSAGKFTHVHVCVGGGGGGGGRGMSCAMIYN